jgi:hypothetical protein
MRRLLILLAALAALVPLAAGCGDDDEFSVSASEAAAATREAEGAKVAMTMKMRGMGLPVPLTTKADGVTALTEPRMDVTFDFGSLMSLGGAGGDGKTRVLVDGADVFVDPPAIRGLDLPGGAQWVTADLREVLDAMGIDPSGFGELMRMSPDQQLAALEATGDVKEVGKEEIRGEQTVHLRGSVRLSDYIDALPAERGEAARKALDELSKLPGADASELDAPTPFDMWIGEDKLVRRITSKVTTPAQQGVPGGEMEIRMDFSDFGTPVDVSAPDTADVHDATSDLVRALKAAARGGAVPG